MKKIDLNKNALKNFTTVRNEEKKFKKYLQKLMDKGYLSKWNYDGVCITLTSNLWNFLKIES